MFSPLLSGQNLILTLEGWTVRATAGVIVAAEKVDIISCGSKGEESRVESVLGGVIVVWEREEKGRDLDLQMVYLGGSTAHFRFATRVLIVFVRVAA